MKVLIFHASAGHGHKKVAEVIYQQLLRKGLEQNQVAIHDALDLTPSFFRIGGLAVARLYRWVTGMTWSEPQSAFDRHQVSRPASRVPNWRSGPGTWSKWMPKASSISSVVKMT